jgi:hypothetical protein
MNSTSFFLRGFARFFTVLTALAGVASASSWAQGGVTYAPAQGNVEGNMPYTRTLLVKVYKPEGVDSATVSIAPSVVTYPKGSVADALSYISASPSMVTYASDEFYKVISVKMPFLNLAYRPGRR